jgi:hypothetical protein
VTNKGSRNMEDDGALAMERCEVSKLSRLRLQGRRIKLGSGRQAPKQFF